MNYVFKFDFEQLKKDIAEYKKENGRYKASEPTYLICNYNTRKMMGIEKDKTLDECIHTIHKYEGCRILIDDFLDDGEVLIR